MDLFQYILAAGSYLGERQSCDMFGCALEKRKRKRKRREERRKSKEGQQIIYNTFPGLPLLQGMDVRGCSGRR